VDDYVVKQKTKPENGGSAPFLTPDQCAELVAHLDATIYTRVAGIRNYVTENVKTLTFEV
jgi:hypothetical protein